MISERHAFRYVELSFADGTKGMMHFVTGAWAKGGRQTFSREATNEAVNAEIARTVGLPPILSWRFVESPVLAVRQRRPIVPVADDPLSGLKSRLDAIEAALRRR